jgi:hypothetical protein
MSNRCLLATSLSLYWTLVQPPTSNPTSTSTPRGVLVISMNTSSCLLLLLILVQIYVGFLPRGLWSVFCSSGSQLQQDVFISNSASRTASLLRDFGLLQCQNTYPRFCIMTPSSLVGDYQCYSIISRLHLQGLTCDRTFLHKGWTRLPSDTAS